MSRGTVINNNNEEGTVEVVVGSSDVVNKSVYVFSQLKHKLDCCFDSAGPSSVVSTEAVFKAGVDFLKRGGKIRFLTQITKDNLPYCKELMKHEEVLHLDGVKGNFGVSEVDNFCFSFMTSAEGRPFTHALYCNMKRYVQEQQFLFNTLWDKAIPAEQRIREIEQGEKREFEETIREPLEIKNIQRQMLRNAKKEISILFPTVNSFYQELLMFEQRQHSDKLEPSAPIVILELLKEAAEHNGVYVRILISGFYLHDENENMHEQKLSYQQQQKPSTTTMIDSNNNTNKNTLLNQELLRHRLQMLTPINIRVTSGKRSRLQTKLMTLIVDNELSLTIDYKENDDYEQYDHTIKAIMENKHDDMYYYDSKLTGLATYTNSEARVQTYTSMFELLWIYSEQLGFNSNNKQVLPS